jgi:peroxiredoxin-like protein
MHPLPHTYTVRAGSDAVGTISIAADGLPELASVAPKEFDGPGDQWSPEALLCASIASCFILTFRAVARVSKIEWRRLECRVEGVLERVDGVMQFTRFVTHANLTVPADAHMELCKRSLEKAEHGCLVANSLKSQRELRAQVVTD